jgi:hypothetical protein
MEGDDEGHSWLSQKENACTDAAMRLQAFRASYQSNEKCTEDY